MKGGCFCDRLIDGRRDSRRIELTGSPGRSRTYCANPDSKSGGPCRKTNRGLAPQGRATVYTAGPMRAATADLRRSMSGGSHGNQSFSLGCNSRPSSGNYGGVGAVRGESVHENSGAAREG